MGFLHAQRINRHVLIKLRDRNASSCTYCKYASCNSITESHFVSTLHLNMPPSRHTRRNTKEKQNRSKKFADTMHACRSLTKKKWICFTRPSPYHTLTLVPVTHACLECQPVHSCPLSDMSLKETLMCRICVEPRSMAALDKTRSTLAPPRPIFPCLCSVFSARVYV